MSDREWNRLKWRHWTDRATTLLAGAGCVVAAFFALMMALAGLLAYALGLLLAAGVLFLLARWHPPLVLIDDRHEEGSDGW